MKFNSSTEAKSFLIWLDNSLKDIYIAHPTLNNVDSFKK